MAKVDTQSIPSEDLLNYKRACQISTTTRSITFVRGRFPWRLPRMQEGGLGVSPGQKTQRGRFKYVFGKYALLSPAEKERWKDANPEWSSYLFGYNFFMLEGLMGAGPVEFPQMIKSIQVIKESVPPTGGKSYAISTVDPAKVVVLIQGNSVKWAKTQRGSSTIVDGGTNNHGISPSVDPSLCEVIIEGIGGYGTGAEGAMDLSICAPYAYSLSASQLTVKMVATFLTVTVGYSWQVIEHKETIIYPVLVSIAANAVVIDWATVPDIATDVSITVVEYL